MSHYLWGISEQNQCSFLPTKSIINCTNKVAFLRFDSGKWLSTCLKLTFLNRRPLRINIGLWRWDMGYGIFWRMLGSQIKQGRSYELISNSLFCIARTTKRLITAKAKSCSYAWFQLMTSTILPFCFFFSLIVLNLHRIQNSAACAIRIYS